MRWPAEDGREEEIDSVSVVLQDHQEQLGWIKLCFVIKTGI